MNNRFLMLFVSFVLAIAVASAQLAIYNPTNSSVNPGVNATGTFILGNTNTTVNATSLTCSIASSSFSSRGITGCPAEALNLTNSSLTYWVFVPAGTASGNYTATITASGTLSGVATTATSQVRIEVLTAPSLSLSWITEPTDVYQGSNATGIVNITNNGNTALNVNLSASFGNTSVNYTSFSLSPLQSTTRTISINTSTKTRVGVNSFSVTAVSESASASLSKDLNVNYYYCSANSTVYPVYIEEITNKDSLEDKDFKPSDSFIVKVKVHNSDVESKYAIVKAVLMGNSKISDTEETASSQKISSGSEKTFSLNITIPSDIKEGVYTLFVKAYDDDKSSNCEQETVKINVEREDHEIILKGMEIPATIECDNVLEIKGILENLGSSYEEKVRLYYSDGMFSDNIVFDELDSGDQREFSFVFSVPKNAVEKTYTSSLRAYFDYDDEDEAYDESDSFLYSYAVSGNCFKEVRNASLTSMSQTAFVSKDTDVAIALANTGNMPETYTISATSADFTIKSITPSTITLPAGSTVSVVMKVAAKDGTSPGMHSISVNLAYAGKTETKTISLDVQKETAISGIYNSIKNALSNAPWMIIFNVVLGIIIIGLVVKLIFFKPKAKAAPAVNQAFKSNIKKNFK